MKFIIETTRNYKMEYVHMVKTNLYMQYTYIYFQEGEKKGK